MDIFAVSNGLDCIGPVRLSEHTRVQFCELQGPQNHDLYLGTHNRFLARLHSFTLTATVCLLLLVFLAPGTFRMLQLPKGAVMLSSRLVLQWHSPKVTFYVSDEMREMFAWGGYLLKCHH